MTSPTSDRRFGLVGNAAIKAPCACATTANITLSGEQTIDGVTTSASRVLVRSQTNTVENGIYDSSSASWTRAADFNGTYDVVVGTIVSVAAGTSLGGAYYRVGGTTSPTIGTSSITFVAPALPVGSLAAQLADVASAATGSGMIGYGPFSYAQGTIGGAVRNNGIDVNVYANVDPTGVADSTSGLNTFFASAGCPTGSKVVLRGTYKITGRVTISGKNLCLDMLGSTFNLSGHKAGFLLTGTITNFDVFGGVLTGDSVNRDADTSNSQIAFTVGNDTGASVSGVRLWGVWAGNMNQGFKFAQGGGGGGKSYKCHAFGCTAYNMIGIVGGMGYGFSWSQADGSGATGCTAELCERHGLYFSEGKDYVWNGVEAISCGLGASKCGLSISRSAQVTVNGAITRLCYQGLEISSAAAGTAPDNVMYGITVNGYLAYNNVHEDMTVGTTTPVVDGVPTDVYVQMVARQKAGATESSINIYSGDKVTIDCLIHATAARTVTIYGTATDPYIKNIVMRGSIHSTGAYGVQIPAETQVGTSVVQLKFDQVLTATAPFEFVSGEDATTNNNLFYRSGPTGGAKRTYTSSAGGAVTIPVGGLEMLIFSAGAAHTVTTLSGMTEGQKITLYATNGSTTLTRSASFELVGAGNVTLTSKDSIIVQCIGGVPTQITAVLSVN